MKKIILFFICLIVFSFFYPAFADETNFDNSNWGIQPVNQDEQQAKETSPLEKIWNKEQDENIYDNYGSEESPAFLDRENIDPGEYEYDYNDDSGNNVE